MPSKRDETNATGAGSSSSSGASGTAAGAGTGAGGATAGATIAPDNGEQQSPTNCELGANATINGQVASK